MNKFTTTAAILGALAFAAAPVYAQRVSQPDHIKGDSIKDFHGSSESLIQAINTVQQATNGQVVEIRFSEQNGMPGYHVVLLKDGQVSFMHLDEQSGQIVGLDSNTVPAWMLSDTKRGRLRLDRTASVSLVKAIRTAEGVNGGAAVAAGIASQSSDQSDIPAYNVLIDHDGQVQRVAVDTSNGLVIADPRALQWP